MSPLKQPQPGMSGRVDWTFVFAVIGLVATGTIAMLSAASTTMYYSAIIQKHFIALALGSCLFFVHPRVQLPGLPGPVEGARTRSRSVLMAAVLVIGTPRAATGRGSACRASASSRRSWRACCVVLVLADYLDRRARRVAGRLDDPGLPRASPRRSCC